MEETGVIPPNPEQEGRNGSARMGTIKYISFASLPKIRLFAKDFKAGILVRRSSTNASSYLPQEVGTVSEWETVEERLTDTLSYKCSDKSNCNPENKDMSPKGQEEESQPKPYY